MIVPSSVDSLGLLRLTTAKMVLKVSSLVFPMIFLASEVSEMVLASISKWYSAPLWRFRALSFSLSAVRKITTVFPSSMVISA